MQIKTTMKNYYTTIKMVKILKTGDTRRCWGYGATGAGIHYCWWAWDVENRLEVSYKVKNLLPADPRILLLDIYPRERHERSQ